MYEHRHQPLVSKKVFARRMAATIVKAASIIAGALGLGIFGYHFTENMPWLDALLNASMILSGMGPVGELKTAGGKWFASFYAIFSGVVFITTMGVVLAPIAHRFLHHFHLSDKA